MMYIGSNILFKSYCPINDKIGILIPTVAQVLDYEQEYYGLVSSLTAMPIDLMVQLDDAGIDFTKITEYELFQALFMGIREQDTHLIFGDLDLTKFEPGINPQNNTFVFYDEENDIVIDEAIYVAIAETLRKIHHLEKNIRKPGNIEGQMYMLQKERKRLKKLKNKPYKSSLEPLIIAMVNTAEFKYDFESVQNLTIFQFNESVRQVIHKIDYDNRMFGIYSGTVSATDIPKKDLTWIPQDK